MITSTQLFKDFGHIKAKDLEKILIEEMAESQDPKDNVVQVKKQVISLNGSQLTESSTQPNQENVSAEAMKGKDCDLNTFVLMHSKHGTISDNLRMN